MRKHYFIFFGLLETVKKTSEPIYMFQRKLEIDGEIAGNQ